MAMSWELESEHLGVVRVSGKVGVAELKSIQDELAAAIQASGAFRMLLFLEGFEGWAAGKGWEDTGFVDANDDMLDKMAFVGEERWRDLIFAFTLKGLRPVEIEYFMPHEADAARAWLAAD